MQNKSLLSYLIIGLIFTGNTPSAHAKDLIDRKALFVIVATALAPYMYKCCTKEDPLTRYDLDALLAGNDICKNLYYLYLDGFLGTPEKAESFKIKNKEGGKLSFKPNPKREATGVIGTIHANVKHLIKVAGYLAFLWAITNDDKLGIKDFLKLAKDPAKALA